MATPSFYCPNLRADITNDNPIVTLSEGESGHAIRSRRLREGQEVNLLNGEGLIARGVISDVNKRAVSVEVIGTQQLEKTTKTLTIA